MKDKKHGFGGGSLPIDETKGEGLGGFRVEEAPEPEPLQTSAEPAGKAGN